MTPTVPVTVTYELTDLGLCFRELMREFKTWAEGHMDLVLPSVTKTVWPSGGGATGCGARHDMHEVGGEADSPCGQAAPRP